VLREQEGTGAGVGLLYVGDSFSFSLKAAHQGFTDSMGAETNGATSLFMSFRARMF
jgi:hypothetical protein